MRAPIKLTFIAISIMVVTSCTPQITKDLWNGVYSKKASIKSYDKKLSLYYDSKTPEWKERFRINSLECNALSEKKYPPSAANSHEEVVRRQDWYKTCLKERGTPAF